MFKKLIEMGKRYPVPLWTIILFLLSGITTVVFTAYKSDNSHLEQDINDNSDRIIAIENKCPDFATIEYLENEIVKHEKSEDVKFKAIETKVSDTYDMVLVLYKKEINN